MFDVKKAVGYGALLWLIMFAVISAVLPSYEAYWWMKPVMAVVGLMLAYVFSRYENPKTMQDAFGYGIAFVVVGLVLDYIVTYQYAQYIFVDTTYWLSYAIIFFAPVVERAMRLHYKKR